MKFQTSHYVQNSTFYGQKPKLRYIEYINLRDNISSEKLVIPMTMT